MAYDYSLTGIAVAHVAVQKTNAGTFEIHVHSSTKHPFSDYAAQADAHFDSICGTRQFGKTGECIILVGESDRLEAVWKRIAQKRNEIYLDMLEGREFSEKTKNTGGPLDVDCLSRLYLRIILRKDQIGFPRMHRMILDADLTAMCLYSADEAEEDDALFLSALEIWLDRECPWLLGKQVMTRSFSLSRLVGRRVIACVPSPEDRKWTMLLQGGIALPLEENPLMASENIVQKTKKWTAGMVTSILCDPAPVYGKAFNQEIFSEWNFAFLYSLVVLNVPTGNARRFRRLYLRFLEFVEAFVSDAEPAPVSMDENKFLMAYAKMVDAIRGYLRGGGERTVSLNALMTMRSRFGYLQPLFALIREEYPDVGLARTIEDPQQAQKRMQILKEMDDPSSHVKGRAWEDAANVFFARLEGLLVTGIRVRQPREEIDLCIANASLDEELWQLGALILAECKNLKEPADVAVVRNLSHRLSAKGCHVGVLFSRRGLTSDAEEELYEQALNGQFILTIDELELQSVREGRTAARAMLLGKYDRLIHTTEDDDGALF